MELSFRTKPACRFEQTFIDCVQYSDISEICNQIIRIKPIWSAGADSTAIMHSPHRGVPTGDDGQRLSGRLPGGAIDTAMVFCKISGRSCHPAFSLPACLSIAASRTSFRGAHGIAKT
ncbi:MAG: hypothetical protein QNJ04_11235 [Desulfobacterales bacterium]|nr:hypothetical protein [Desulfobacterales bacterium]